MILLYSHIPAKRIRAEAKEGIGKLKNWFKNNPERSECNVRFWYGQDLRVHRNDNIEKVINEARDQAIGKTKIKPKAKSKKPKA